jgi:hypothetical protein
MQYLLLSYNVFVSLLHTIALNYYFIPFLVPEICVVKYNFKTHHFCQHTLSERVKVLLIHSSRSKVLAKAIMVILQIICRNLNSN